MRSAGLESMAALAKALGVTQSTLTNIQSGARSASPELIRKIEQLAPRLENGSILGAQALSRGSDVDLEQPLGKQLEEAYRQRLQELHSSEEMTSKNIKELVPSSSSGREETITADVASSLDSEIARIKGELEQLHSWPKTAEVLERGGRFDGREDPLQRGQVGLLQALDERRVGRAKLHLEAQLDAAAKPLGPALLQAPRARAGRRRPAALVSYPGLGAGPAE